MGDNRRLRSVPGASEVAANTKFFTAALTAAEFAALS